MLDTGTVPARPRTGVATRVGLLVLACRPRQWLKNALVPAPVVAAGTWLRPPVAVGWLVALLCFTVVASGVYLVNDLYDLDRDRRHPQKRRRPLASGRLPASWAWAGAVVALAGGPALALGTDREALAVVLAGYALLSLAYSVGLKAVPGLELLVVAAGFVWRPLAGAAATLTPVSAWFFLVCCLAALTVASGKRLAELTELGPAAARHRPSLRFYRLGGLRALRRATSAAAVACYLGWALTRWHGTPRELAVLSAVPLVAALARYAACNDRGRGGAPEALLLADRPLQLAAAGWLALFVAISHG